jgi:hypothetical protein
VKIAGTVTVVTNLEGGIKMAKLKYPNTIAAIKSAERSQWEIGDALLEECGPPSDQGIQDGSREKLAEAYEEIKEQLGDDESWSIRYLAQLRQVAFSFPERCRRHLSWRTHLEAGDPDILDEIIKSAPARTKITRDYVNNIMQQKRGKEKSRSKEKGSKQRSNKKSSAKKKEDSILIAEANFIAQASEASSHAKETLAIIEPFIPRLPEDAVAAMTELALEVANCWTEIANAIRKTQRNKRGHLQVVNS